MLFVYNTAYTLNQKKQFDSGTVYMWGPLQMKYMVDTNIINWLIDGTLSTENFPQSTHFVATHIQRDELSKTPDPTRKHQLLNRLDSLIDSTVPTESTVLGTSRLGSCKLGNRALHTQLKERLDSLNNKKRNNFEDALIAEAAIVNGHTLITADEHLRIVAQEYGCAVALLDKYRSA